MITIRELIPCMRCGTEVVADRAPIDRPPYTEELVCPDCGTHLAFVEFSEEKQRTIGDYGTEPEVAGAFDAILEGNEWVRVYREVEGTYVSKRPGTENSVAIIDRILMPTTKLLQEGWKWGPIGVELKAGDKKLGKVIAQCIDYRLAAFNVNGAWFYLDMVFIFPLEGVIGDVASVMSQWRIGNCYPIPSGLKFQMQGTTAMRLGRDCTVAKSLDNGYKMGSR